MRNNHTTGECEVGIGITHEEENFNKTLILILRVLSQFRMWRKGELTFQNFTVDASQDDQNDFQT
jgi:hypothetical protein